MRQPAYVHRRAHRHRASVELLEPRTLLAAGDLDPTFDGDGVVVRDYPKFEQFETDIALFNDGEFAVGGTVGVSGLNHDVLAARFTPAGRPYTFFSRDGFAQTDNAGRDDRIRAIAIDAGGNVLAAGVSAGSSIFDHRLDAMVVRYTPDGSLDPYWGNSGRVFIPNVHPYDILVQPDGKVVVVAASGSDDYLIARLTERGQPDLTFGGGDGIVLLTPQGSVTISRPGAVALAPDGAIVVAGEVGVQDDIGFGVIRLRPDGSPDPAFGGGDGMVTTTFPSYNSSGADALGIYADGKIVAGGYADSFDRFALARYNPDGSLDTSFSSDGLLTTDLPGDGAYLHDLRILANGAILAVGEIGRGADASQAAVVRYRHDGSLDTTFAGGDGILTTRFGRDNAAAHALALRPDGRILVSGSSYDDVNFDYDLVIAQLQSDVPPNGAWIAGKVYDDKDKNNQYWTGDAPIAGARVFIDADNDFAYDPDETSVLTNAEGNYAFTFLPPADYQWGVVPPAGYEPYLSSGFYGLPLAAGQQLGGKHIALVPKAQEPPRGTAGNDTFLVRLDASRDYFEVYDNESASGTPVHRVFRSEVSNYLFDLLAGDDLLIIDGTNGNPIPSGEITVTGGAGHDVLRIVGSSAADQFDVEADQVKLDDRVLQHSAIEDVQLDGAGGWDALILRSGSASLRGAQALSHLLLQSGTSLSLPDSGDDATLQVRQIALQTDSTLDLHGNELVIRPVSSVSVLLERLRGYIATARNATPPWSLGLTTSNAIGKPLTGLALRRGERQPGEDFQPIIIRHAYNGDANQDGRVNADDYFQIDSNFLAQPATPTYAQGDFNYDGTINADDYFLIDSAFLGQGASLSGSGKGSPSASTPAPQRATTSGNPLEEPFSRRKARRVRPASLF